MHITQRMGGLHLHVQMCPFPYLGNDCTDGAEICFVIRYRLASRFTEAKAGVHLHVCVPLFRIYGLARHIALKFDAWLGDHKLYILRKSWVG